MRPNLPWPCLALPLLCLGGCPEDTGDDDSSSLDDDDDTSGGDAHHTALVTTSDFSVGSLATVDLDTWEIDDEITAVTGDSVVRVDDGKVLVINRFQFDSIRVYDPSDLRNPELEFSTMAGANPQTVLSCGGKLFVTRLELDSMGVYDAGSGMPVGEVDLSAYVDDDGAPEAATMVRIGDKLYVGLQRLDRDDGWLPDPDGGRVVEVDCATAAVTRSWETGPNVMVQADPRDPDRLLLFDGAYYDDQGLVDLDGGVRQLDPADDQVGPYLLTEEDLGGNIIGVGLTAGSGGIVVTAEDAGHTVWCLDTSDWSVTELWTTSMYYPEIQTNDRGEAWLVARTWIDPADVGGLQVVDMDACTDLTGDSWLTFSLEPFSVAFL